MKNIISIILITLFSTFAFTQNYPRIETDSTGLKLVVMTVEQAQKIDNAFELLQLLEKAGTECDSLNLSYVKVIDGLKKQVSLLEVDVNLYKGQITDKDKQLDNFNQRLSNCETSNQLCDQQISIRDEQIGLLSKEIKTLKTKRNIAYGAGIGGVVLGILLVILTN